MATARKKTRDWEYRCDGRDNRHGCFSADFDGVCEAYWGSSYKFFTQESAEKSAKKHEQNCRWRGKTNVRKRIKTKKNK